MLNLDPFVWWIITISWSIVFLILVSIYLYRNSKTKRREGMSISKSNLGLIKDFVFVWVLISLLVFYIISVNVGSALIFALGNIVVEVTLIAYLVKNGQHEWEQKAKPRPPIRNTSNSQKRT